MTSHAGAIQKSRGCAGSTIRTFGGIYFDLLNPTPDSIHIEDIAHALSKICRYGGHCPKFYSVAEHCLVCADVAANDGLDDRLRRSALMHDAAEAYIGDVVKPLKNLLPELEPIERRIEEVIAAKFDCDFGDPRIKEIDFSVLIYERRRLFGDDGVHWAGQELARRFSKPLFIECQPPRVARQSFLEEAYYLGVQ